MTDQIKRMPIKEFRESGYLQELNRRFLHPLGLAIEVSVDDLGDETLGGIRDFRDDPAGIYFDISDMEPERKRVFVEKFEFVRDQIATRKEPRREILGFVVEPVGEG